MTASWSYLLARATEPSTWRGLVWGLAAVGLTLSPDQSAAIVAAGAAVAGAIGVFTRDRPSDGSTGP